MHNRLLGRLGANRANHVRLNARDLLGLVVELVEDLVILGTAIGLFEWNISRLLLLKPGISIGNVTN